MLMEVWLVSDGVVSVLLWVMLLWCKLFDGVVLV